LAALLARHSSWQAFIVFCWATACEDMTISPVSVEQMTAAILIFISYSRISGAPKQFAKWAICANPKMLARSLQSN
jgi:hypothetical protein